MAKYRKKKGHRSQKMTLPVAVVLPAAWMAYDMGTKVMAKDVAGLRGYMAQDTNGGFNPMSAVGAYGGLLGGFAVHYVASKIGVNRALGRARIPFIRI